jgi:hypothetical protein
LRGEAAHHDLDPHGLEPAAQGSRSSPAGRLGGAVPWADLTLSGQSMSGKASIDPSVLTPEGLKIRVPD